MSVDLKLTNFNLSQVSNDLERDELKNALVATQESAALQILLEACIPTEEEKKSDSLLTDLREVQSIVCLYLHEAFISDPNMAKLVHFQVNGLIFLCVKWHSLRLTIYFLQGYPLELLSITVAGVPSMHICLDFIPELLSQPDLEKQLFAVDLLSHLSTQFSLPKSYSMARLAVNALYTLLSGMHQTFLSRQKTVIN